MSPRQKCYVSMWAYCTTQQMIEFLRRHFDKLSFSFYWRWASPMERCVTSWYSHLTKMIEIENYFSTFSWSWLQLNDISTHTKEKIYKNWTLVIKFNKFVNSSFLRVKTLFILFRWQQIFTLSTCYEKVNVELWALLSLK